MSSLDSVDGGMPVLRAKSACDTSVASIRDRMIAMTARLKSSGSGLVPRVTDQDYVYLRFLACGVVWLQLNRVAGRFATEGPVLRSRSEPTTNSAAMSPDELDDLNSDMEMTTKEAAAYLSGPVAFTVSVKLMYGLKSLSRGPVVEKRGRNLVYRRSALDAFLREYGNDPTIWIQGLYRDVADQLRAVSEARPDLQFGPLIETLNRRDEDDADWDPDLAK